MSKNSSKDRYVEIKKADACNKVTLFGSIDEDYIKNALKQCCDRRFGTFDMCINETNSSFRILDMSLIERSNSHNDKYVLDYYSKDDVLKNKTLDEISHQIYNEVQRDKAKSSEIPKTVEEAEDVNTQQIDNEFGK